MKPWREAAIPHKDVLEGTFLQSAFAADITAVRTGKAGREYQDAKAFFERTFITEGMGLLLTSVAQRLTGRGGDPVIQLQTAFGGGKTHTMLAVYHLATRTCPLSDLQDVPNLIEKAGLMDLPAAKVAVLDGTAHGPGQPWLRGKQSIRTLWGELAWQLGGEEALAMVKEADATGTSPGKDTLRALLEKYAPCVVLIDELVAYIRQFPDGQPLSGGSYESNLSFVQSLTEAVKLVPNAIVLASLPESEVEAGAQRGIATLKALEKTFGRVHALWKPVATEEAFEIVRRRLFEPLRDNKARDEVCRAFFDTYKAEGAKMPSETHEARYFDRLTQAYPVHPEVFDRLYEDWTTIDGFQRTRGVLKLMAKVIYRLWKDQNRDLMILPGSLPLDDGNTRNELTYYLNAGWDPVVERDIDGERAETTELESKEPRFGAVNAARRVARTIFLGSAPSSVSTKAGIRGIDRARVLLGCLQPGQTASTYSDALNRLIDRLHYLNASGDKAQDATRFWFDTRANLRREMEDRKKRFEEKNEVRGSMAEVLRKVVGGATLFEGIHTFTPHSDVPDDSALRLVILAPEHGYAREENRVAFEAVQEYVRSNGVKPRYRGNRLMFLAPDSASLSRLRDCIRVALAWGSIVEDIKNLKLNIDGIQQRQANEELQRAQEVLPRVARECYKWLLCPSQAAATDTKSTVEAFPLNTGSSGLGTEIERVCAENELVIAAWSPIHLRAKLKELYWKADKPAINAFAFWEDSLRYLYLPRLRGRDVLAQAVVKGAASRDFFGTAYGYVGGKYEGFKLGDSNIQVDETLLLIEPSVALAYQAAIIAEVEVTPGTGVPAPAAPAIGPIQGGTLPASPQIGQPAPGGSSPWVRVFHGTAEVSPAAAKVRLVEIANEIVEVLGQDPTGTLKVTLEIHAEYPNGVPDHIRRAVSENAPKLGMKDRFNWE